MFTVLPAGEGVGLPHHHLDHHVLAGQEGEDGKTRHIVQQRWLSGNISNQSSIDISQTKEVFSINLSPNSPPGVIILNLITLSFVEN